MKPFDEFVQKFIPVVKEEVINISEFGSEAGEVHPEMSDIDLLIVCKDKSSISHIMEVARELEGEILGIKHSKLSDFLQRHLLFSNDFTGLHLILLSKDELNKRYEPLSWRLRFITTFIISRTILLYEIKHKHRVIFGRDLSEKIVIPQLSLSNRFAPFILPMLVLLTLPLSFLRYKEFKIWCFKVLKYHGDLLLAYSQLKLNRHELVLHDLKLHELMIDLALRYRYNPNKYRGGRLKLYFDSWKCLLSNLSFIWRGPELAK